jgi:hypothetical protein
MSASLAAIADTYLDELGQIGYDLRRCLVQPGLTDTEIDVAMEPTGLVLPDEARGWCRFQNGLLDTGPYSPKAIYPNHHVLALGFAVEYWTLENRSGSGLRRPTLFPLFGLGRPFVLMECGPIGNGSMWRYSDVDSGYDAYLRPGPPSLAGLFEEWTSIARIGAIDCEEHVLFVDCEMEVAWYADRGE